jgi:hypothetical protein
MFGRLFTAAVVVLLSFRIAALADIASDYAAITSPLTTINAGTGTPGDCAIFGRTAFPFIRDSGDATLGAAGLYNDAAAGGRGACLTHTVFFDSTDATRATLLENLAKWAGKKANPLIGVQTGQTALITFFQGKGYTVRTINSTSSNLTTGGAVDVYFLSAHNSYALAATQTFTAAGGGLVVAATPWALSTSGFTNAQTLLTPFGIGYTGSYAGAGSLAIPATPYSNYYSGLLAADALVADRAGTITLSLADKTLCAGTIDKVFSVRSDITELNTLVENLSASYGWITPTKAVPLVKASKPVEAMLARYQWRTKFDALPANQLSTLFPGGVHPGASDWPGLPAAGSTVTKTVSVNGNTPADVYMNQGSKPTRIETGLYAAPGATINIAIPANKTAAGLQVHIGGSEDDCFNLSSWSNFPRIWRRIPLTAPSTDVGHVFGGLITLLVPAGSSLGTFNVTITGALDAPAFVLGQTTDAQWNATVKNNPGAWGYIQNSKLTIYLPRWQLTALTNAQQVTQYWQDVMDTSDYYYGYETWRKRGEVMSANRQVAAGAAYAGYPIELGWGADSEVELNSARTNGEWGSFHELGHGFQDDFDGNFGIAIGAEIDVNINPGILSTIIHDRSPWDNITHSSFDASDRIAVRSTVFALPAAQQTWENACATYPMAYDFYFNIAEAFGWSTYRTALGRLMRYLQSSNKSVDDPGIFALSTSDTNYIRNRFFLIFCDATQRDLTNYFSRYGIKSGGATYGLTASVIATVQAKGYAAWDGNVAPTALSNPGTLAVAEDALTGTALATFTTTDSDPGEIFTYQITGGNTDGAFTIDRHTGVLRVSPRGLDRERATSYSLTVTSYGNGIPFGASTRPSLAQTFTVNVSNVAEPPQVAPKMFTATSAMSAGTSLGTMTAVAESPRTITAWSIVSGNAGGLFAINAAGSLTLSLPASLPNPGIAELIVRATDSTGAVGYGAVKIVCNSALGLTETRWTGQNVFTGTPAYTGTLTTFTTAQNVADNYSRKVNGYLVPQITGYYTFWIASDDDGALYLSTDSDPANKTEIAYVSGYTSFQQWTKYGSQQSAPMLLQAGRAYYIEATQIEGGGGDHLSVGWMPPGGSSTVVIPQSVLAPYKTGIAFSATAQAAPTATLDAPLDAAVFTQGANVNLSATIADNFNTITKVQFLGDGAVIAEDYAPPYTATWTAPALGAHTVTARAVYSGNTASSAITNITIDTPIGVWKRAKFGANYNNAAIAGDLVDYDGDGMTTLLEYATNTDPLSKSSVATPSFTLEPPNLALVYRRNLAATDITFSVEESIALPAWSPATTVDEILSDDGITRVIKAKVPIGSPPAKFLRLKITRP